MTGHFGHFLGHHDLTTFFMFPEKLSKIMANPLASSQAHKFACGLASVGVGLGGPMVDEDVPMAEVCLERGQVALLGRDGELGAVRLWLASALDALLGAGDLDKTEVSYLLNWLARLWSLYWTARGRADRSLRVLYAGRVAGRVAGGRLPRGEGGLPGLAHHL